MRLNLLVLTFALAGCGDPIASDHFANDAVASEEVADSVTIEAKAVRIGELGSSFAACEAGTMPARMPTTKHITIVTMSIGTEI